MEKADLTAPSGLLFTLTTVHLHTFRRRYAVPEIDEGRFASFLRSDFHAHCALALLALFGHKTKESCAQRKRLA